MTDRPELVHLAVEAYVATVTLDSPDNRNALSRQLVGELTDRLQAAAETTAVRVVVLTHTGGTFCAGADLAEAVEDGMERGTRALLALLEAVVGLPVPVLAVVRGHVRAGGLGLLGACDLAIVSNESSFGFAEVRLGLTPAIISLTTRNRLRDRDAAHLYLSGEVFDGRAAAAFGLANQSVPETEVESVLADYLADLGQVSPQGLRETKALLNLATLERIRADGERLVALSARLFASDEAREGMQAFRERRVPAWQQEK